MTRPIVFIASSSEGFKVAKEIRALLEQKLGQDVEVRPWTREFELSATYIESLEKTSDEADFAVLVLTPDDITLSREVEKLAPRDNVVFELGLFMGCIGRKRCFIVNEDKPNLKLPTDLLGIKAATFKRPTNVDLKTSLQVPCNLIGEQIIKLGIRYKLSPDVLTAQMSIRSFCDQVEGVWWERITRDDASAISFFHVEWDANFNSVCLVGKSYNQEGHHSANWKSAITRVEPNANKILYHWKGWHTRSDLANIPFHGFGEMEFDKPGDSKETISRGGGRFWNVDEAHPEMTIVKPIELRRVLVNNEIDTMKSGSLSDVRSLIKRTLRAW